LLGSAAVISDEAERQYYSADVYSRGATAALVIVPDDRALLPDAVREITQAGYAVVPRGGGMSYTGGYTPQRESTVIVDLSQINNIVDISPDDMTITVEAGVTWKQIYDALDPLELRLPFFGTFSGIRATVGGGMSNGALFMGTARYGTAAEIALGFEVVTSDGRVVRTGQAAVENGRPFYRTYGPDLTGLFIHDAGSLGIKTLVSMRLITKPAHAAFASFVFADQQTATAALSDIARSGATEEAYVFDPATTRRSLDSVDLKRDVQRLMRVVKAEKGFLRGLKAGASLVGAGRSFIADNVFSLHVVCAGMNEAAVENDLDTCRRLAGNNGGGEIANSMPKAARANPFEPLNGILGADGERWAALNSKVAHSGAMDLMQATDKIIAKHQTAMQRYGVTISRLYIAISNHAFSYEPVLRWHDAWLPVHRRTPEPNYLAGFEEPEENLPARELVDSIRAEIVSLFQRKGVASNQIGKTYPYFASLLPETAALVRDLKRSLDPEGLMNPGALGIPEQNRRH
jgi:FAD/FMN-containing dehydrogenase